MFSMINGLPSFRSYFAILGSKLCSQPFWRLEMYYIGWSMQNLDHLSNLAWKGVKSIVTNLCIDCCIC